VEADATRGNSYTPMRIFTVKLPPEVYTALREKAKRSGTPMAVIARRAITEYLGIGIAFTNKNGDKPAKIVIKG